MCISVWVVSPLPRHLTFPLNVCCALIFLVLSLIVLFGGQEELGCIIRRKRLTWLGHVARTSKNRSNNNNNRTFIVPLQGIYSEALSVLAYDVKYRYEQIFSVSSQD